MALPLNGGPAREILPCAKFSAFNATAQGLYYLECGANSDATVHLLNLRTTHDLSLGSLENFRGPAMGLGVSPDGDTILYSRTVESRADLMLIENFR